MQENWIGKSRGLQFCFRLADAAYRLDMKMERLHNEVARLWAASGSDDVQANSPPPTAIDRWRPHVGQFL